MAVVSISMDTARSETGSLLPQDVELNAVALQLFHYACMQYLGEMPERLSGTDLVIDRINFSNPFDIWAFLKKVPVSVARVVLDRTIFYQQETAKRSAEAAQLQQSAISKQLDNLRKAVKLRDEILSSGGDPEKTAHLLGNILYDQKAIMTVSGGEKRRRTPPKQLPY